VGKERAAQLLERYGTRAAAIISELAESGDTPLQFAPAYSRQEIERIVRTESVVHLSDVLQRRTSIAFTGGASTELLTELAGIVSSVLSWTDEQTSAEVAAAADILRTEHGVQLETAETVSNA
jgi:glycerol-3-phosphate dehydrogenase